MRGFAMIGPNETGFIEKDDPKIGPRDALVKPLAVAPCTSDIHTVYENAIGPRHNLILGHEASGAWPSVMRSKTLRLATRSFYQPLLPTGQTSTHRPVLPPTLEEC